MNSKEYKKLEKVLTEGILAAKQAHKEFKKMNIEDDWDKKKILELQAQNHLGYAEGINQCLVTLGFNHERMPELRDLI